jgi:iron complex transport system substrate-binding protein
MKNRLLVVVALAALMSLVAGLACGQAEVELAQTPAAPEPTATHVPEPTATPESGPIAVPTDTSEAASSLTGDPVYEPVTLIDGAGQEFVFTEPPERIMAYGSAVVEILFAIGEGHRIVGTHDFVEYPPEASEVTRVGSAFEINVETILALEPDLVYLFSPGFMDDLQGAGLRVLFLPSRSSGFEETAADIRLWGRIVGNPDAAEELAVDFEERLAAIKSALAGVGAGSRVFRDEGGLWTPGPDTLIGEVLELLKLDNIAFDISGFEQISPEVIVDRDPEIIIATDFSTIDTDEAFSGVTAIKDGRVFRMPGEPLSVPGTRFIQGIEDLARQIYPELFP